MLQQKVNVAMPPAYAARNAGGADALESQETLCAAIRALVTAVMAGEATTDGLSMDMVVNEFCALANMLDLAGRRPEAEAAFDEAEAAACRLGTPEHQARVAVDRASFLRRRAAYAQAPRATLPEVVMTSPRGWGSGAANQCCRCTWASHFPSFPLAWRPCARGR
jgi:hypothetical protein